MFGYDSSFSQAPDMAIQKQLQTLTESEINGLYSPPVLVQHVMGTVILSKGSHSVLIIVLYLVNVKNPR